MPLGDEDLQRQLTLDRYPRSARYPARWVVDNQMGPNPLWLAEALAEVMPLEADMRVLDMGCGTALTSIFLAKEFGVQVWATDLWIKPTANAARIDALGMTDQVFPIYADAHALPFAEGFFDAAVSYDAYHYFGTDNLYIGYFSRFVKPGGRIGFVVPGLRVEPDPYPPPELAEQWVWDFCAFHSPTWWRRTLESSGLVAVDTADMLAHGHDDWLLWSTVTNQALDLPDGAHDGTLLRNDTHHFLGFTRITAHLVPGGSH